MDHAGTSGSGILLESSARAGDQGSVKWQINELVPWKNLYASKDPVSNGPMFLGEYLGLYELVRGDHSTDDIVHNRGSLLTDHTTYWTNIDQFVSKVMWVALLTAEMARIDTPLDKAVLGIVHRANRERPKRVRWLRFGRLSVVVWAAVCVLVSSIYATGFLPWVPMLFALVPNWARTALELLGGSPDEFAKLAVSGAIVLCTVLGILIVAGAWSRWDRIAIRQCLSGSAHDQRKHRSFFLFSTALSWLLLTVVTAAVLLSPLLIGE
jgi:hypothetical protein